MILKELPDDDGLWFVKWIDEFRIPYLGTRSPSVSVLIQRLPDTDPQKLSRLTREEVANRLAATAESGQNEKINTLVGNIPLYTIGKVFKRKELVGELPSAIYDIELSQIDTPNYSTISLSEIIEAPLGWNPDYDYRLLNKSEYPDIFTNGFAKSKCIVHENNNIQYIIPLTVIFKCFYGFSARSAKAFCKGPWIETQDDLVYRGKMYSGLETKNNQEEGTWDIILQPKTDTQYAHILAALIFDKYANSQANALYTKAIGERKFNKISPWLSDAQIPFDTSIEPLKLHVKGYHLRKKFHNAPRKFLVSYIINASYPEYFPQVRENRFNNNDPGDDIEYVDEPRPYSNAGGNRPATSKAEIQSDLDAELDEGSSVILGDSFSWSNNPPLIRLQKDRSKRYVGETRPSKPQGGTDKLSGGIAAHKSTGLAEAETKTISRDPSNRFKHIMSAFEILKARFPKDHRFAFSIFGPSDSSMLAMRGGWSCWNFLDPESRETGIWPSRGWRLVEQKAKNGYTTYGIPRCALVVEINIDGRTGYWIEIETRPNGNESLLSPFIRTVKQRHDIIEIFIEAIAQANGKDLRRKLFDVAKNLPVTTAPCYRHDYISEENSALDVISIYKFLCKNMSF